MQGLRLAWSKDNTISENLNQRLTDAEKIYIGTATSFAKYKDRTHPNVPGCLCCPSACSLFTEGAPPPGTVGQPLPFCGFISWTGEDCAAVRLQCQYLSVCTSFVLVNIANIPVVRYI